MNQTPFTRATLFGPAANNLTATEEAHRKKRFANRHAKRKKPRWKDRVAPAPENDGDGPKDNAIDEETLTLCTRCPAHRNRAGRFRPLIGSGEHVCDDCYRREFPATAMLDDVDESELRRASKRASDFLRNKIVDNIADIFGITRMDPNAEMRRTDEGDDFPSEVECRMCLERGVFRRCCSSYYCHLCYYKSGRCPGCEADAPLTGVAAAGQKPDPGITAVGLSWALTILLILVTVVVAAFVSFNAATAPKTVWGHACRGWFPVCDLAVCVDHDGGEGYGDGGEFLPAAQPYRVCERASSADQVVGSACVYDQELYAWSNKLIGYDICVSSPREENSRPRNVSSPHPLLLHTGNQSGVYIFDDDFEEPSRQATSPWSEVINGNRSSACGVNNQAPERGQHGGFQPVENKNALHFTGVHTRHATTAGLNIEHGGRFEFYLKMGPMATGDVISECKTAFNDIILEYNTVSGEGWLTFGTYPAWKYRGHDFQFVSTVIPADAWSNSTQFRFRQPSFDVLRDHWAIDDVRIWADLKFQWKESTKFEERRVRQNSNVKFAQCCYNTDQCSVFDKKRTSFDDGQCGKIPGFDMSKSSSRLKLSELVILYLCLAACGKLLYRLAVRVFMRRTSVIKRGQCNDKAGSVSPEEAEMFPRRSFRSKSQQSWQYTLVLTLVLALAGTVYCLSDALMFFKCSSRYDAGDKSCKTDKTFIFACIFAAIFDIQAIGVLLGKVFCIEHPWIPTPLTVVVDLHPDRAFMHVGSKKIPLSEISEITRQDSYFYGLLSSCHALGGLPFALGSLTFQSFDMPSGLEAFALILGCVAILREVFGPSLFAKLYLSIGWVLTLKQQGRDDLGRSLLRKGLLQQCVLGSIFCPVLIMLTLLGRSVEDVSPSDNFILFLVCASFGGLFGLLLGIMRGIPVTPFAKLTGWPSKCCSVSYYERVDCPCLFSCTYCGEMHSHQRLLIVALDDMYAFKRMLQGNPRNLPSG